MQPPTGTNPTFDSVLYMPASNATLMLMTLEDVYLDV
jgi:hypothetical protein